MLRDTARRLLGVECSKFLRGADVESERWEPFRRWRDELQVPGSEYRHTVVTFNYDRVLEMLGFGHRVLLPHRKATPRDRQVRRRRA